MLFNSFEYILFLPIVFALYWATNAWRRDTKGLKLQNALLLLSSYVFYGWWDWRFLSLIAFSTLVDWTVGLRIQEANQNDNPDNPDHRSDRAKKMAGTPNQREGKIAPLTSPKHEAHFTTLSLS